MMVDKISPIEKVKELLTLRQPQLDYWKRLRKKEFM